MTADRGRVARFAPVLLGAVAIALVAGGVMGALPMGDTTPDGETVLDRAVDRYDRAETVVGNATVTVANETTERTWTASFAAAADQNATRVSTTYDGDRYVAATNGSVAWVHDVANDTVRVYDLDNYSAADARAGNYSTPADNPDVENYSMPADGPDSYANVSDVSDVLGDNATATVRGTTTIDGAETYVVAVEPTNDSVDWNATVWVDTEDYRVHRMAATDGTNRTTVGFDAVQFNVSVHESTFRPPDDADVTVVSRETFDAFDDAQAATDLALQRPDADGYAFEEAVVVTRAGQTAAIQQYTGETTVTLVATAGDLPGRVAGNRTDATTETVTVAGANATYVDSDDGGAVVWTDDGVTRAVLADADRETLLELAESVRS